MSVPGRQAPDAVPDSCRAPMAGFGNCHAATGHNYSAKLIFNKHLPARIRQTRHELRAALIMIHY
jgi:hypothetical protein